MQIPSITAPPPATLDGGRYRLEARIGKGGMGAVYRAFDERFGRWRAIKVLDPRLSHRELFLQRFETEATVLADLEHPNVVRVFDIGTDGDLSYIVMELADGGSAASWIARNGPMPPAMAVGVALDIAQALVATAACSIVHRDIKPDNILVTRSGVVKLADFGISRRIDAGDTRPITSIGIAMGSRGYMSPEQCVDAASCGLPSDVYSLGATLYTLLTGRVEPDLYLPDEHVRTLAHVPEELRPLIIELTQARASARPAPEVVVERLTAALAALPEVNASVPSLVKPAPDPGGATPVVLVVDDDPDIRALLDAALRESGLMPLLADSVEEAVRIAEEFPGRIDMVLTDMVMPRGSGLVVARQVAEARPGIRLMFMSAHSADSLRTQSLDVAEAPLLQKPLPPLGTAQAVERMIREHRTARVPPLRRSSNATRDAMGFERPATITAESVQSAVTHVSAAPPPPPPPPVPAPPPRSSLVGATAAMLAILAVLIVSVSIMGAGASAEALPAPVSLPVGVPVAVRVPPADDATLTVRSDPPGAEVWEGSVLLGHTPITLDGTAEHHLVLSLEGYQPTEIVRSGKSSDVEHHVALVPNRKGPALVRTKAQSAEPEPDVLRFER